MNFPRHLITTITLSILAMATLSGCNSSAPAPSENGTSPAAAAATTTQGATATAPTGDMGHPKRPNERWKDANGVEYLGDVPLDVFFDQPYDVVNDGTAIAGGNGPAVAATGGEMATVAPPTQATASTPDPSAAASGSADNWSELIPIATLKEEVNATRNFLNQSLQAVGAYNSSMLMIPPKAASVAALATIAMEHQEDISWKEDAKYIRNLAKKMNESTLKRGKKDQARLLTLFENMADTLNRSKPAGLEEPPEADSFADVAEMRLLMMRMAAAEKRMKNEAGSETAFGTQKEMILHESAILGTMTKVVTMSGYGYEDDEEFLGYAQRLIDATKEIRGAAEVNDFATYEQSLSKVATACTECHSAFKNN